ncbi:hypothetical protein Cgig2_003005 [Carnegiea gigantea]|uniref:Cytochrome P450 n=1 Tax=Carnegiea gigantea TaxID=171969 RepID=A0A9Q1GKU1_9CARY|nr:hypothetical protein Cgig2_003005 [Carnegiea gigantea]
MLPAILKNVHRIHDFCIEIFEKSPLTFLLKGPWFANMEMLLTVDPPNVHHIMSKNFDNYAKGPKFNEIFDVLGDGIFNADFELWKYHRRMAQSFLAHPRFHWFLVKRVWEKAENGLVTILEHACKQGLVVDFQDLFERFTFDTICTLVMGQDFGSLSIDMPRIPFSKALDDVEAVFFHRHVIPMRIWKFMRWLGVGKEKKHEQARKVLDEFIYKCVAQKREEMEQKLSNKHNEDQKEDSESDDLLTLYMMNQDKNTNIGIDSESDKFFRDTILSFFIAGQDTTSSTLSWFFYLLSKNPQVESKIRQELSSVLTCNSLYNFDQLSDELVYLHGSLCETLRSYPPVVFETKSPVKPDILPSGHKVNPNTQIIFNLYATGRMKSIWGDNRHEFCPERWISEKGKIKHEPSYKFLAFNAGLRTCLGKDMAFTQMKMVAAVIIQNYHIQAVEGHPVVPDISIIFRMKHGFKAKVLPAISTSNPMTRVRYGFELGFQHLPNHASGLPLDTLK